MASNYSSDQDMERALKQHFEAEANDLGAPENLWESLEGRLEGQPRVARLAEDHRRDRPDMDPRPGR